MRRIPQVIPNLGARPFILKCLAQPAWRQAGAAARAEQFASKQICAHSKSKGASGTYPQFWRNGLADKKAFCYNYVV
jgi:hypothetical protein